MTQNNNKRKYVLFLFVSIGKVSFDSKIIDKDIGLYRSVSNVIQAMTFTTDSCRDDIHVVTVNPQIFVCI